LEEHSNKAKQERKHIIMILSLVVLEIIRSVRLVTEPDAVDERYAAFPISSENIPRNRCVYVVLSSGKIP